MNVFGGRGPEAPSDTDIQKVCEPKSNKPCSDWRRELYRASQVIVTKVQKE